MSVFFTFVQQIDYANKQKQDSSYPGKRLKIPTTTQVLPGRDGDTLDKCRNSNSPTFQPNFPTFPVKVPKGGGPIRNGCGRGTVPRILFYIKENKQSVFFFLKR